VKEVYAYILVKKIPLNTEYSDIYSIEYKGILYINLNYDNSKYGPELFNLTM
jgi:hypothetical protein